MLVTDINDGVILAINPKEKHVGVRRKYLNRTNGIAFGPDGALYGCQEGSRRVIRMLEDGSATTTTTRLNGKCHNHPCLLTVDQKGRVWFSDSYHRQLASGPQVFPPLEHQSVLRLTCSPRPHTQWQIDRMTFDTTSPRGIALSPDEKTLYVAETSSEPGGTRELRAYRVHEDGTLGGFVVLHTFGADARGIHRGIEGVCVDTEGNIVACAGWSRSGPGPLIYVFSPTGAVLETHPVPADLPLNCAFGDAELTSLYVTTASGHLFRATMTGRTGHLLYPARR